MSRGNSKRDETVRALIQELRNSSSQGVLLSQAIADKVGINSTDLECLDVLAMSGSITAGLLAEITGLTTGAITGVIDRLEKAGFVERVKDPDDRRRVIVRTVKENIQKIEPFYSGLGRAMSEVFARYSDEELSIILDFYMRSSKAAQTAISDLRGKVEEKQKEGTLFSAPLGNARSGHLLFETGAAKMTIRGSDMSELYRARFEHPIPDVKVHGGNVRIHYPGVPFLSFREKPAEVTLNSAIPWKIEISGGASNMLADLSKLEITGFEVSWGINNARILLPKPSGTVPVKLGWGVKKVSILRPEGTAMRFYAHPGTNGLTLDGEHFAATAAKRWETDGYGKARDRYDVEVTYGAKDLLVGTR